MASRFYLLRYQGDTVAARSVDEALDVLIPDADATSDDITVGVVRAPDACAARLFGEPKSWRTIGVSTLARWHGGNV